MTSRVTNVLKVGGATVSLIFKTPPWPPSGGSSSKGRASALTFPLQGCCESSAEHQRWAASLQALQRSPCLEFPAKAEKKLKHEFKAQTNYRLQVYLFFWGDTGALLFMKMCQNYCCSWPSTYFRSCHSQHLAGLSMPFVTSQRARLGSTSVYETE